MDAMPPLTGSNAAAQIDPRGALPIQLIRRLMRDDHILGAEEDFLQPSSLDLTISEEIYRMRGSYLPRRGERIRSLIRDGVLFPTDLSHPLELHGIYLVRLNEGLALPPDVYAYTNNKSSSGRVNLQTRLLVDGMPQFDKVPAGYGGELWLEIVPKSFPVRLTAGERLNQMRFFTADTRLSTEEHLAALRQYTLMCRRDGTCCVADANTISSGGVTMSIDLSSEEIVGYKCSPTTGRVLDFSARGLDPLDYFEPIFRPKNGQFVMKRDEFYIFVTHEGLRVPPDFAVEMAPYDPTKGEFRSHYAGFIDPGWGYGENGELPGAPVVLEVFTHDNDFVLRDGQPICKMVYERLAERARISYGDSRLGNNYGTQRGVRLSKHFTQR